MDDEEWREAVASPREVVISARLRLIQLNILHRVYITGPCLIRMGKTEKGDFRRNCGQEGTFIHIIWECEHIQQYWRKIHAILCEVLTLAIHTEVKRCLLNVWEPTDISSKSKLWVTLGLMNANRNIAQLWGAVHPPKLDSWKTDMDWCMFREKTVYVAQGCPKKWSLIWNNWNAYRGNICNPPSAPLLDDPPSP